MCLSFATLVLTVRFTVYTAANVIRKQCSLKDESYGAPALGY